MSKLPQEVGSLDRCRRQEGKGTFEEVGRCDVVATGGGPSAAIAEEAAGALAQHHQRRVGRLELGAVAVCLLEVVAEDLVVLADAIAGALLEPVGVALVQGGAELLGRRAVGGVADEDVLEAVGDQLAGEARGGEADQVLAARAGRARRRRRAGGLVGELDDGAAVEELAFDRAALECVALARPRAGRGGRRGARSGWSAARRGRRPRATQATSSSA